MLVGFTICAMASQFFIIINTVKDIRNVKLPLVIAFELFSYIYSNEMQRLQKRITT